MNNNFYNNCFTELDDGEVNAEFNKATLKCFDSKNNKFSMDCEGNLVVNSIIAREGNNSGGNSNSLDSVYPIGSIYMSVVATNPSTLFGGTWEQIQDKFLLCGGENYAPGTSGGNAYHSHTTSDCTLNVNQIPSHQHTTSNGENGVILNWDNNTSGDYWGFGYKEGNFASSQAHRLVLLETGASGGNQTHNHGNTGSTNNMPPYLAVYVWKRTA